ncbi:MAG: FtsX-like permease family protein [Treponema sp.]|nr:FtsX-like permease family protein [Treponema sp.]
MKTTASLLFASRLLFPRTGKKSNARKSLIGAMVCIGISLVPLVMVLTVSNGMIQGITERMIGLSTSHISCVLHNGTGAVASFDSMKGVSDNLNNQPGIVDSFPEIQGMALVSSFQGRTGASVRAVENDIFSRNKSFASLFEVLDGKTEFDSDKSAIIGGKLAEILGVKAGDTIRLITIKEDVNSEDYEVTLRPRMTSLKISGIVSSGYQELDALWLFLPIETGFKILPLKSSKFVIGIETENAFDVSLERAFRHVERNVPEGTRVFRWNELNSAEYENFSSTQTMLLFIMMLIVLVASVNISSALIMLVMERRKEIAILRSIGASPAEVARSFLLTGVATGFIGVLIGIPCGLLCSVNFSAIMNLIERIVNIIYEFFYVLVRGSPDTLTIRLLDPAFYLQNIPLSIPLPQLIVVASGTLVLSLLVSAVPAVKAGSERPIETLRKI